MDWQAISEINFGRLIRGQITPTRFDSSLFYPPFDRGFQVLISGGNKGAIIKEVGLDHYQSATHAAESLNGTGEEVDWAELLERASVNAKAAEEFERLSKRLRANEEIDWSKVNKLSSDAQQGAIEKFHTLEEVWEQEEEGHWQKSGVTFLDYWLGGWPTYGLCVIGGRPKVGKTTFVMGAAIGYVKEHPDKNVVIFSLEMMISEFKERLKELEASGGLTQEQRKRIILCEEVISPSQAVNWASVIPNVGIIFIDFADLMVEGEVSEMKMTALYRTLGLGAKTLKTCIVLLSQLSRSYQGGIPRPFHIRYTGMAEALVVLNLMLYVPWTDYFDPKDTDILEVMDGTGYVIKWFTRYKTVRETGIPHAILVEFDKAGGWKIDERGERFSLEK